MRDRLYLLLIPVGALLAVLPLIARGASCGHDFEFHIFSWLEVGSQWKQGVLLPHWEFTAAWNSGEPRFVFYPPLSWVIGALLGLVLPWLAVPATFIWLSLAACGFTMYRLAREWTCEASALVAAGFYMVHPYMLFTFFERSAYAELLAAAWIPLMVLAILRPHIAVWKLALPLGLLWLTNNPAAVMGCYSLALLAAVRLVWTWIFRKQAALAIKDAAKIVTGTCLGLSLAGFYLVPATAEQRWVHITMTQFPGTRYQDNFLFGRSGSISHQAILRTASLCSVALLILIAVFAVFALCKQGTGTEGRKPDCRSTGSRDFVIIALLLLASFVGFLLSGASALLWRSIPELKYLQFPWRFGTILGVATAALVALALDRVRLRPSISITFALVIPLLFSASGNYAFRQSCDLGNDVASLVDRFRNGDTHDPTDEYTPATSDPLAIGHDDPSVWLASTPAAPAPPFRADKQFVILRDRLHFIISSSVPAFLVINLREYPAWHITINGTASTDRPHRQDGLIVIPISTGRSVIAIRWVLTPDRIWGWALSIVALAAFVVIWRKESRQPRVPGFCSSPISKVQ